MGGDVHIGCGAGFAGDRFDAAVPVVETLARHDGPRYLIYEVMGERTLAIAQRLRRVNPDAGHSPYLERYLSRTLAACKRHGIRIVTNMGNANPLGAARRVHALARDLGIDGLRVAAVLGDDLLTFMSPAEVAALPVVEGIGLGDADIVAANAYLGARPVADALATGADVVLVGRTTDAALVLGPLLHEFGWAADDWDRLAVGTVAGHLLECAGQVTGGYFCDPGFKDVPDLAKLGFPIGEVSPDGDVVIGKADGTGGQVSRATVCEQLLYEVHDPGAYLTPDVVLDMREVTLEQDGDDRVRVRGARGAPAPDTLKATVSVEGGWLGEATMAYAGPNALARARLAADVLRDRSGTIAPAETVRVEVLGTGAVFGNDAGEGPSYRGTPQWGEYLVRAAVRSADGAAVQAVVDEVQSLFCSGPAGGGGFRGGVSEQIRTASVLVPRAPVESRVRVEEVPS